jgi:hypothetical protein
MTGAVVPVVAVTSPGSLVLAAPSTNTKPLYVGGSNIAATPNTAGVPPWTGNGNGLTLAPGQVLPVAKVGNAGQLYAIGTSGDLLIYAYGTEISQ